MTTRPGSSEGLSNSLVATPAPRLLAQAVSSGIAVVEAPASSPRAPFCAIMTDGPNPARAESWTYEAKVVA